MRKMQVICNWVILAGFILGFAHVAAAESPYKGVTLRVAAAQRPEGVTFAKLAPKVEKELGIKVEFAWFTHQGLLEKVLMDTAGGLKTWDLLCLATDRLAPLVSAGSLTPVGDFLYSDIADPEVRRAVEQGQYVGTELCISDGFWGPEGTLWGIPFQAGGNVLVYRKDLMNNPLEKKAFKKKYGYELQPPKFYTQYRDIAEFFTRKKGEMLAGKVLDQDFYGTSHSFKPPMTHNDYMNYAYAYGYTQIWFDKNTMQPTWDSPLNKMALEYVYSLLPYMPEAVFGFSSGESTAVFVSGNVFMIVEFSTRTFVQVEDLEKSVVKGKVGCAPPPSVKGSNITSPSMAVACPYAIYSLSKHKEAAYKLLEKMLTFEYQKEAVLKYLNQAALATVYRDPEVITNLPFLASQMRALELITPYISPLIPEGDILMDISSRSVGAYLTGQSIEQALAEGQREIIELFKEKGYIK